MKNKAILIFLFFICFKTFYGQDVLFSEDFEEKTEAEITTSGEQGWDVYITTSSGINIWSFSGDDPINGSMSLAIDENTTDAANTYDNFTSSDKIAYYATQIDATNYYNLSISFKWICNGEYSNPTYYDYGKLVYSTDETNWFDLSSEYANETSTQSEINLDISSLDNSSFYIGFQWVCDNSLGTDPPFAVDDIEITGLNPVSCVQISYPLNNATEISQTPILIWEKNDDAKGYKIYLGTDNPPTNIINGSTTPSTAYYIESSLAANTTHYLKVVPYNNGGDASGCSVISFTTIDPTSYTEWDGSSSSDWGTAANWSSGVPDQSKNVIIPVVSAGANKPTISSDASVNNITFETGGVLTINDGVTLSVHGEWNNYFGTLKGSSGIIEFKGTGSSLSAFSTPSYEIDGLETTGASTTTSLGTTGDYRGGIAVTPDYVYITGDGGTIRMDADNFSSVTSVTERNAFFSDLLTGKLYTLWNTDDSDAPDCLCDDNSYGTPDTEECLESFEFNALCELNADLSASSNIIPLVDIDGNPYSITCKGGQKYITATSTIWTYRTGIFPGYGFLLLFADNDSGNERMYAVDIQSGEVDSLGFKNITPELEVSEGYANWGFGEYDGSDYFLIYKMKNNDKLRRVNLTTMETSDYIDFSGTDGLAFMSSITFSPWKSSWYFYLEGASEFYDTGDATTEVVGYATGSNKITVNAGLPEVLTNVTINKTNPTDKLTLSSPLTLRDLAITQGIIDVSSDNHELTIKGDLDIAANGDITIQNGNVVFGGLSNQTVSGSSLSFYDLTLNKSSGTLILSNEITISNSLTLTDGVITTGSYLVELTSSAAAALSGGSSNSFIYGDLKRAIASNADTYTFPVGNGTATTNFYQVDVINNNLAGVSDLTASVEAITETGNNIDANITAEETNGNRYTNVLGEAIWTVTPSTSPSGGDYGVNLYFGNLSGSLTDNMFGVLKRNSGSTSYADWDAYHSSTTVPADGADGRTVASGFAQRLGYNSFSEFSIGTTEFSLPVEWVDFHGYAQNNNNMLRWSTASEINNERFIVERSEDGLSFMPMGEVDGNGDFNGLAHYAFIDTLVEKSMYYYRIKQVDFNGNFDYSKTIDIQNYEINKRTSLTYLNNSNQLQINFGNQKNKQWNILIIDYSGKIVYSNKIYNPSHEQFVNFKLPGLNRGLYLINLKSTSQSYTTRMMID